MELEGRPDDNRGEGDGGGNWIIEEVAICFYWNGAGRRDGRVVEARDLTNSH